MADLRVDGNDIVVTLNVAEALVALRREVRVPLRYLRMVHVEESPLAGLTPWRLPGLWCPGTLTVGCARFAGGREFAAAYAGQPAVVLDADEGSWQRVVVSHRDAAAIAADLAGLLLSRGPGGRGPGRQLS